MQSTDCPCYCLNTAASYYFRLRLAGTKLPSPDDVQGPALAQTRIFPQGCVVLANDVYGASGYIGTGCNIDIVPPSHWMEVGQSEQDVRLGRDKKKANR